jgi:hypothetical protein
MRDSASDLLRFYEDPDKFAEELGFGSFEIEHQKGELINRLSGGLEIRDMSWVTATLRRGIWIFSTRVPCETLKTMRKEQAIRVAKASALQEAVDCPIFPRTPAREREVSGE